MKDQRFVLPFVIIVSGLLCGLLMVSAPTSPVRLPVVLLFLFLGPGLAIIPVLRIRDWTFELMLGISLSLVLDALFAGVALYAGMWNPVGVVWGLVLVSWVGAGLQIWQITQAGSRERRAPGEELL